MCSLNPAVCTECTTGYGVIFNNHTCGLCMDSNCMN